MITIKLTQQDYSELVMALGVAQGASSAREGAPMFTRIVDRILVQGDRDAYTYGKQRSEVESDLRAEGIEVPA